MRWRGSDERSEGEQPRMPDGRRAWTGAPDSGLVMDKLAKLRSFSISSQSAPSSSAAAMVLSGRCGCWLRLEPRLPFSLLRRVTACWPWRRRPAAGSRFIVARGALPISRMSRSLCSSLGEQAEIEQFRRQARSAGALVNVIDTPEACDFQFGTIVNRSPVIIGISTDGASPILGQALRRASRRSSLARSALGHGPQAISGASGGEASRPNRTPGILGTVRRPRAGGSGHGRLNCPA